MENSESLKMAQESSNITNIPKPYKYKGTSNPVAEGIDLDKYEPYLGKNISMTDQALNRDLMAESQSTGEKLAITALNTVGNIASNTIGDIGGFAEVFASDDDYSNAWTEWAHENRNWLGGTLGEVYTKEGDTDWYDIIGSGISSVVQFGLEGAAIGSGVGAAGMAIGRGVRLIGAAHKLKNASRIVPKLTKYIGRSPQLSTGLSRLGKGIVNQSARASESFIPRLITSTALSHAESTLEAAQIYKDIGKKYKDEYIKKFGEVEGAKKLKELQGTSAKYGKWFAMMRNIPLNLTVFKWVGKNTDDVIRKFDMYRKPLPGGGRETAEQMTKRLDNIKKSKEYKRYVKGGVAGGFVREGSQEALEELNVEYAKKVGEKKADAVASKELKGVDKDFSYLGELLDFRGTLGQLATKEGQIAAGMGWKFLYTYKVLVCWLY